MPLVFTTITVKVGRTQPGAQSCDHILFLRDDVRVIIIEDIAASDDDGIFPHRSWFGHDRFSSVETSGAVDLSFPTCGCLIAAWTHVPWTKSFPYSTR